MAETSPRMPTPPPTRFEFVEGMVGSESRGVRRWSEKRVRRLALPARKVEGEEGGKSREVGVR